MRLRAGGDIVEVFLEAGPKLVIAGIFVTMTPVAIGYLFGRKALRLNPVLLLGATTVSRANDEGECVDLEGTVQCREWEWFGEW